MLHQPSFTQTFLLLLQSLLCRVTVNLTNPINGVDEEISISTLRVGLTISPSSPSHFIQISGIATMELYTDILRSLTYQHLDFGPGNPSTSLSRYVAHHVIFIDVATSHLVNENLKFCI